MSDKKDAILSVVKAVTNMVPVLGSPLSEFISYAQNNSMNEREEKWKTLVEAKLARLQNRLDELSRNQFYVSVAQKTTFCAMQAYQDEKRALFANILFNAAMVDIAQEKQMLFITLLEQYTMLQIKLLGYLSEEHYDENNASNKSNRVRLSILQSQEKFLVYLSKADSDFSEIDYVRILCRQLMRDGLIREIDFEIPQSSNDNRQKLTTFLGDTFLSYIRDDT